MSNIIQKGDYFSVSTGGFVGLVDYMGNDAAIDQAARVSYGQGTRAVSDCRGLLRYLMRHRHTSPFEMCEVKFHIRIPMDTWRQMVRHRTASINEYSTRYSVAIDECATTPPDQWRKQSTDNKQGSNGIVIDFPIGYVSNTNSFDNHWGINYPGKEVVDFPFKYEPTAGEYLSERESELQGLAREVYEERLKFGVAREQARKDLPLSNYTEAYYKIDLHNLFHFLHLRLDSHAQQEIREYATVIAGITRELFPISWEAFEDYVLNGVFFNINEWSYFHLITGRYITTEQDEAAYKQCGLTKSEAKEVKEKIAKLNNRLTYQLDWSRKR